MNIDQEKDIVQALPSLYPLKGYEEDAIHVVINALLRWMPTSERLPKTDDPVLVTLYNGAVYEAVPGTDKNVGTTKEQCENCIHCSGAAGNTHCFNCTHYYGDNFAARRM